MKILSFKIQLFLNFFSFYFKIKPFLILAIQIEFQIGKRTAIWRKAVRETGISRHHGGPFGGQPPETPLIITALSYWEV